MIKTYREYIMYVDAAIHASNRYYKDGVSIISDYQFDMLLKDIELYEKENPDKIISASPTQHVGSDLNYGNTINHMQHSKPMLSLENTYNSDEVNTWLNNINTNNIVIEEKLDGCSGSFTFINGVLVKALTRGNGIVGEDITDNMKLLNWNIDSNFTGEVRGEILMTKQEFIRINDENSGKYANPRNLVAGTIKLLDKNEFTKRKLIVKMYWLVDSEYSSHNDTLNYLEKVGFDVVKHYLCETSEVNSILQNIEVNQKHLDYCIDGAVMKVDNILLWDQLGSTSKYPRYAKAYKFVQEEVETIVESIEFQVGRTGKVTPCCNFKPVTVDGSTISRCTLNNIDYMTEKDVRIGDTIVVHKAAAIIPEIVSVDLTKRPVNSQPVKFITHCPECGTELVKEADKADHFCPNVNCKARLLTSIEHFTHAMEIDGFGPELISAFNNNGILTSITDVYEILTTDINKLLLEGIGVKTIENLKSQLEKSKTNNPEMLLTGIGILGVGKRMAKLLIDKFKTIDNLLKASFSDIVSIEGFGEIKSRNIYEFIQNPINIEMFNKFKQYGLNFGSDKVVEVGEQPLAGKTYVITGALSRPRNEFEALITNLGGKLGSSVTSKTTALITNTPDSGSSKNKKAQQLGIDIITEEQFISILKLEV